MTQFVQDVFAEAHALNLTDGFIGTYNDLKELVLDYDDPRHMDDGFAAYETHLEDLGWADKFHEEQMMLSGMYGLPALAMAL